MAADPGTCFKVVSEVRSERFLALFDPNEKVVTVELVLAVPVHMLQLLVVDVVFLSSNHHKASPVRISVHVGECLGHSRQCGISSVSEGSNERLVHEEVHNVFIPLSRTDLSDVCFEFEATILSINWDEEWKAFFCFWLKFWWCLICQNHLFYFIKWILDIGGSFNIFCTFCIYCGYFWC